MDTSALTTTELLVILDVTRRLAEQRMIQPLIEYVGTTVFDLIAAERCLIVLFGEDGELHAPYARTRAGGIIADPHRQISNSILDRVRATLSPMLVNDALNDSDLQSARSVRLLGLRSVVCVPLISYGQAIGVIYVENRSARGKFREESLVPLVLFSHQVVVALENARVYEALEARVSERTLALQEANALLAQQAAVLREQSIRDGLTGQYNRRYFNEILLQQFHSARENQRPLTIACADIDNFKRINDTLFHAMGDQVLVAIGTVMQRYLRTADVIARMGGEEFAILLPDLSLSDAIPVCERLRLGVMQHDWAALSPGLHVTISIGAAEASSAASPQELLHRADARLYRAKHIGKNRVISSDG
jgi:diguanylate cyclase (GGDEF)-like protein